MGNQIPAHHLILAEPGDTLGALVPLVDQTIRVNPENRCVGRVDKGGQVVGHPRLLNPYLVHIGDVPTHHQHQVSRAAFYG